MPPADTAPRSCLRFSLGVRAFGVPLEQVREVVPVEHVHPVPLAPPNVLGLLNVRGQVLTLLHTAGLLGLVTRDTAVRGLALVLAPPLQNLALFVQARVDIAPAGDGHLTLLSPAELAVRVEERLVAGFRTGAES
jgi:purine-binding chemotaxis protein CheW